MKNLRWKLLLLVMVGMWLGTGRVMFAAPFPDDCAEVCGSTTSCNEQCYPDELAWINGNWITCLQWGDYEDPCCGDTECTGGETASSCFGDCHCGDDVCNAGETIFTCPSDCDPGDPPGGGEGQCGDEECTGNENCDSCPQDCFANCGYCGDGICKPAEYGGGGSGNPPQCNPNTQSWCQYCPADCGECNPQVCDPGVCGGELDNYQCRACQNHSECPFTDYACVQGSCVLAASCTGQSPTFCSSQYGSGWSCGTEGHCIRSS